MQTHTGKTALHKAVKNGDIKKINLLLANNADVHIKTNTGKIALDYVQKINIHNEHIQLIITTLKNEIKDK